MSSSSQTSKKLSPVRVMQESIFDPNVKTFDMPKPTEDANAKAGKVSTFGDAVTMAVQYAQDNIDFVNNAKERLLSFVEQSDKLLLETKEEQLSTALQNVYIQNRGNILKCEPEWSAVVETAKKDEDFARLRSATSIENYANNITSRYRITAINEGIKRNNEDYAKLSRLQLQNLQNKFGIAYSWMADGDDATKKNGFLLYSEAVRDMKELLDRKLPDGSPVFSDADRLECLQESKNILGTSYARVSYNQQSSLRDKLKFIENIESGNLSIDAKKFFAISNEFIKDGTEADFGVFNFADMPLKNRNKLGDELRARYREDEKLEGKMAKEHLVQKVLSNETVPTPSALTYRQSVKDYYNGEFLANVMTTLNAENVPQKREKVLQMHRDFIGKLKFIPSEMLDFCFDAIVHPDPMRVVLGCDLADLLASEKSDVKIEDPQRLQNASPLLYGSRLLKNGTPMDVISELVRGVSKTDENVKKQRIKELHEDKKIKENTTFESINKRLFGTSFWGAPSKNPPENLEVQNAMLGDYMAIVTGAYVKSGDLEISQKIADSVVKQKWGTTEVNGSTELTAFPVESFWATDNLNKKSVINRINTYVSKRLRKKYAFEKTPKYYISFDETTISEITNGQTPSYRIFLEDEYGILHDHINGYEERIALKNILTEEEKRNNPLLRTERILFTCDMFDEMEKRSDYVKRIMNQKREYKRIKEFDDFEKEHDERDAKIHEETEELRRKFEKKK